MGMTMGRSEKRDHKVEIRVAREMGGITGARFESPAMGRREMTVTEYKIHKMGRGQASPEIREQWAMERVARRRRERVY